MDSIRDLLKRHRKEDKIGKAVRPVFFGVEGFDVYNPTEVFEYKGKKMICARVERRESEISQAVFFQEGEKDHYYPVKDWKFFPLQDPSLTYIKGYYILTGTEIFPHPTQLGALGWRTVFYYGRELESLQRLTAGPSGMKDVRLVELKDGKIGVFTRPQGQKGGKGKIGFAIVKELIDLNPELMEEAPLLPLFNEDEWGGVNEVFRFDDGRLGVLAHIACFEPEGIRHYYPLSFIYDTESGECFDIKILAERSEFLPGPSKRTDLEDVLFSGGMVLQGEKALLYVGVSDCEVQYMEIENPFYEYNKVKTEKKRS